MGNIAQRSFARGEIASSFYARTDQVGYATGLRTCRNFIVQSDGGVANRPGSEFRTAVKDSDKRVRMIRFVFNDTQSYLLEFGDRYMRVMRYGNPIRVSGVVAWATSTTYTVGDLVANGGTNYYAKAAHTSVNTGGPGVYSGWQDQWHAMIGDIYEMPTPYLEADLQRIQYVQSADVITLTHRSYPVYDLRRTGHTAWTLVASENSPSIGQPENVFFDDDNTGGGSPTPGFERWYIAAVSDTFEEGIAVATRTIWDTGGMFPIHPGFPSRRPAVAGWPITVTWDLLPGAREYRVYKQITPEDYTSYPSVLWQTATAYDVGDLIRDNINYYRCSVAHTSDSSTRPGVGVDWEDYWTDGLGGRVSTYAGPWTSGHTYAFGEIARSGTRFFYAIDAHTSSAGDEPEIGNDWQEKWHELLEADGLIGLVGTTAQGSFTDRGALPDYSQVPIVVPPVFDATDKYPGVVGYYQQRRILASTNQEPERAFLSRIGDFSNFTRPTPLTDDASLSFTLYGRDVNEIQHVLDVDRLLVLTLSGVWAAEGDSNGVVRPGVVNTRQKSYYGSSWVMPAILGNSVVYVQSRGRSLLDLAPDAIAGYKGSDLTRWAKHFFRKRYTIREIAFQETPNSVVWVVRSDGVLLGLTYIPEEAMVGWHRHDTDGEVEQVCVIPEDNEDRVYIVVKRLVDGNTVRYIERLASREFEDFTDCCFMDASVSYDGRNGTATTMTLSDGSSWDEYDDLTVTASSASFTADDVGNAIHFTATDGEPVRVRITAYTSTTVVTGRANRTVPDELRSAATTVWSRAITTMTGLGHLEGKRVSVLADGFVVASPNNDQYGVLTVTEGEIGLGEPYSVIRVGLPYLSDFETLDIDTTGGPSLKSKAVNVTRVGLFVETTRGVFAGRKFPTGDDPLQGFDEPKVELYDPDAPPELLTDTIWISIDSSWDSNGRIAVRQVDPLPLTILAAIPQGYIPSPE